MIKTYTEQMEDALWQKWSEYDTDAECTSTIEFLNAEDGFRSFGEGLVALMQKKDQSMDIERGITYLTACCRKNGVDEHEIGSKNTLKSWFRGGPRPKKGEDSRDAMFALAFALRFTPDETAELFHKVYLDRAFNFRNEKELVYYFCLANEKTWANAKRLIASIEYNDEIDDATLYTLAIQSNVEQFSSESELLNEETLIVLDNFDVAVDQISKLEQLLSLNAKIIVTTRTDFSEVCPNSAYINLTGLGYSNLKQVFELNSGYQLSLADIQQLRKIFILGEECTYYVELIAKLMKRGMYTISEISSMAIQGIPNLEKVIVSKDGEIKKQTTFKALQDLFRLSNLDSCQWEVFMFLIGTRNLALTTRQVVDFIKLHCPHRRTEVIDAINTLVELGYIQPHNGRLIVRDIIYDIVKTSDDLSLSQNELLRIFLEKEFVEPSRVNVEYDDEIGKAQLKYNFKCLFSIFSTVSPRKIDDLTYIVDILFDLVGGREDYVAHIWNRYSTYVLKRVMFVIKDTAFAPVTRIKANCIILTVTAYQTRIGSGKDVKDETLNLMNKSEEFFHAAVTLMKEYDLFDPIIVDKLCLPYMEMSSQTQRFNMIAAQTIDTIIQLNPTKLKSGKFPENDFDIQALRNLNYQKYYLKGVWARIQACKDQEENKYTAYNACMRIFMNGPRAASILDDEHFDLMEKVYGTCLDMFLDENTSLNPNNIETSHGLPMQVFVLPAARLVYAILWGENEKHDTKEWYIKASEENIAEIVNSHPDFKSFSLKLDTFNDLENAFKLAKTTNDTGNKLRNFNEWLGYSLDCLDPKKYIEDCVFSSKPNILNEMMQECERLLALSTIKHDLNYYEDFNNIVVYEAEYRCTLRHSIILFCLLGDEEVATQKFNILMQLSKAYLDCVDCEDITKINHSTMDCDVYFWGTINRLARFGFSKFALTFLLEYVDYVRDYLFNR